MNPSPRSFVLPLIGIVLLFAALGPAIGGAVAYAVLLRLAAIGGSGDMTIEASSGVQTADWIDSAFSRGIEGALAHAFVACSAIAGFVCAMAASLIGLTMRRTPALGPTRGAA